MSKFKIIGLFCLAASIFFIPAQNAFASDIIVNQQSDIIENNSECLEDVEAEYIVNYVQSMLEKKYKNFFSLDNFNATFIDAKNDTDSIDFDISVDMTYIKNPEETDYVKGMYEAITEIQNNVEKEIAQQTLNEYLEEQNSYYMVPERTAFCYRIKMPKTKNYKSNISDCILYNRTDITDEKVLLTPIVNAKSVEDINVLTKEEGKERIFRDIEKQKKNSTTYVAKAVSYNKSKAVEYVKNHVADTPEFSKANNLGSDCANFLSYCIHAGGIPIYENGLWRPSHYGKNKNDTYAGDKLKLWQLCKISNPLLFMQGIFKTIFVLT